MNHSQASLCTNSRCSEPTGAPEKTNKYIFKSQNTYCSLIHIHLQENYVLVLILFRQVLQENALMSVERWHSMNMTTDAKCLWRENMWMCLCSWFKIRLEQERKCLQTWFYFGFVPVSSFLKLFFSSNHQTMIWQDLKCHNHPVTTNIGPIRRQGPHQVAVKSTTTSLSPASFRAALNSACRKWKPIISVTRFKLEITWPHIYMQLLGHFVS